MREKLGNVPILILSSSGKLAGISLESQSVIQCPTVTRKLRSL